CPHVTGPRARASFSSALNSSEARSAASSLLFPGGAGRRAVRSTENSRIPGSPPWRPLQAKLAKPSQVVVPGPPVTRRLRDYDRWEPRIGRVELDVLAAVLNAPPLACGFTEEFANFLLHPTTRRKFSA